MTSTGRPELSGRDPEYAVVMRRAGFFRIHFADLAPRGEALHHADVRPGEAQTSMHRHDFLEFFWVTGGAGEEIRPADGGPAVGALRAGSYAFVTEDEAHAFRGGEGLRLRNVAFPRAAWDALLGRYGAAVQDRFAGGAEARRGTLDPVAAARLEAAAAGLAAGRRDAAALDGFLLQLDDALGREAAGDAKPAWLREALADPAVLRAGVADFLAICGRSREHAARACRKHLGRSPTELVAAARLDHAADLLTRTRLPVVEVGERSGFANAGSFHAGFRRRFGTTPRRHREQARRVVP